MAFGLEYYKLKSIVSLNKKPFWGIIEIYFLKDSKLSSEMSYPSIKTRPSSGAYIRNNKLKSVVFPKPEDPIIAFVVPGVIFKLKLSNKSFS